MAVMDVRWGAGRRLISFKRELAFRFRAAVSWAPEPRPRRLRPLAADLRTLSAAGWARVEELRARYAAIDEWSRWLAPAEVHENLYLLDAWASLIPHQLLASGRPSALKALDVGAKNGSHLPAQHALLPCSWTLVEVDAHRRYGNLVTRRSRGERIARAYAHCRYVAGSVRQLSPVKDGPYDLITWTLPFLFEDPLAAWGLPDRFFEPMALLSHVLSLLAPRGALLVINQGEQERDEQRKLLETVGVHPRRIRARGPLEATLSNFRRQRWAFCVSGDDAV